MLLSDLAFAASEDLTASKSSLFSAISLTGYVDASYNYLMNDNRFVSGIYNRVNDLAQNGFTLQQAELDISLQTPEGFGGLMSGLIGRDAYVLTPEGFNADIFGIQNIGFTIPQAYFSFTQKNTTLMAGEILAISGEESFQYPLDTNFSRSILAGYAQPGSHIGITPHQNLNEHISLIAGLGNGWSTIENAGNQIP